MSLTGKSSWRDAFLVVHCHLLWQHHAQRTTAASTNGTQDTPIRDCDYSGDWFCPTVRGSGYFREE